MSAICLSFPSDAQIGQNHDRGLSFPEPFANPPAGSAVSRMADAAHDEGIAPRQRQSACLIRITTDDTGPGNRDTLR